MAHCLAVAAILNFVPQRQTHQVKFRGLAAQVVFKMQFPKFHHSLFFSIKIKFLLDYFPIKTLARLFHVLQLL